MGSQRYIFIFEYQVSVSDSSRTGVFQDGESAGCLDQRMSSLLFLNRVPSWMVVQTIRKSHLLRVSNLMTTELLFRLQVAAIPLLSPEHMLQEKVTVLFS
jgi:hypothetical protein